MSAFPGTLRVDLIEDSQVGKWRVVEPFHYQSDVAGATFIVPAGFTTDFCSVPRIPIAFDILGSRARRAGVVHDYLYSTHPVDRETADKVLREMALLCGLNEAEAESMYLAVRAGGESHW
jgi:hypothetical protein